MFGMGGSTGKFRQIIGQEKLESNRATFRKPDKSHWKAQSFDIHSGQNQESARLCWESSDFGFDIFLLVYWLGRVVAGSARLLQIFHLPILVKGVGSGQKTSFLKNLADLRNMCHVGHEGKCQNTIRMCSPGLKKETRLLITLFVSMSC